MKERFLVIHGDKCMTSFMQAADVFEKFKVIATIDEMSVEFKDNITTEAEKVSELKKLLEQAKHRVVFIYAHKSGEYYLDETVKSISDGHKWILLSQITDQYLKAAEVQEL